MVYLCCTDSLSGLVSSKRRIILPPYLRAITWQAWESQGVVIQGRTPSEALWGEHG